MLYDSIQFRNVKLENRWVMSPMCMYSAEEGLANDFHLVHYGSRAQGGAGLIILEATAVVPEGRITPNCLGIWNDEQATEIKKVVDFIHKYSTAKVGIQLAHAGRKSGIASNKEYSTAETWEIVAPSDIPFKEGGRIPLALSTEEVKDLVVKFKEAAKRAVNAGMEIIELHAAHGYLFHEFLSPISNQRTDEYGGSFENRIRFLLETVDAINDILTEDQALFVRISGTEYNDEGWNINDSIELSKILKTHHVDLIDVSSGGNYAGQKIELFDGYQVNLAEKVKHKAGVATAAVGLIKTKELAEDILKNQKADLIFVARELLRNPYLPVQASFEEHEDCFFPEQYDRARPR